MTTRYIAVSDSVFSSSDFKYATTVEVLFEWEGEFVRVRTSGHGERVALSLEQGVRFLEAMEALQPEQLPDVIAPPPVFRLAQEVVRLPETVQLMKELCRQVL